MKYLSTRPILLCLCFYLFSCEAEIDVTPDQLPEEKAPKFNFLVRQIESEVLIIDTTFINDTTLVIDTAFINEAISATAPTLVADSIPVIDTTLVINTRAVIDTTVIMDTLKAELYIKQLDFTVEEEKYRLIVTLPGNFDGLVHYKSITYRSGDWIEISYIDLEEYATVLYITQNTPQSKPLTTGQYNFNLQCSDSKENSKSTTLTVKVP